MADLGPVNPLSAGKLKDLWDAIRTAPNPGPTLPPTPVPATTAPPPVAPGPGTIPPAAGVVAGPNSTPAMAPPAAAGPTLATDKMQGDVPDISTMPGGQLPNVTEEQPDINKMPGSDRVTQLQKSLDDFGKTPGLRERLLAVAPVIASVIGAKVGGGQAGASIRGVAEAQDIQRNQQNLERKNLTDQLSAATTEREREYDTAQRTTERANAAADANRTRDLIARMGNQTKENVVGAQVAGRQGVANTNTAAKTAQVDATNASRERISKTAADARIWAGKYAADAAANRQTRSISAAASRQQAGFTHGDEKPTAAEDQRADMAKNFGAVVDELDEIAQRRPELFGPIAGRATSLRNLLGTDDPDVATLAADKEALGQFMLAAHSLRNAGHIATAANSVINAYHNEPGAMRAALAAAKANAFQMNTIVRPTLAGRVAKPTSGTGTAAPPSTTSQPGTVLKWTPDKGVH